MKIKISKRQWENIGKTAGWSPLKESQNMDKQMDDFFSPSITLKRHIMNGKIIEGYWYVDLNKNIYYSLSCKFSYLYISLKI